MLPFLDFILPVIPDAEAPRQLEPSPLEGPQRLSFCYCREMAPLLDSLYARQLQEVVHMAHTEVTLLFLSCDELIGCSVAP